MIDGYLMADGPHPDLAAQLALFGRFAGEWDMVVEFFDDGEVVYKRPGVWSFFWILDGRGIQDVLSYPNVDDESAAALDPGRRRIGTSVRTLDPATGVWQVVWIGASSGTTVVLHGGADGDGILLTSRPEPDGTLNRWEFREITRDGFLWTGQESVDGGETWFLRQRMVGTRARRG